MGIDWEYAASGNPWFDIAVAFYSDELTNEDLKKKFLISYLEEKNNFDESMRKIQPYSIVYTYLKSYGTLPRLNVFRRTRT